MFALLFISPTPGFPLSPSSNDRGGRVYPLFDLFLFLNRPKPSESSSSLFSSTSATGSAGATYSSS